MYNLFFFFKGTKSKRTLRLQTVFDIKEGRKGDKMEKKVLLNVVSWVFIFF